MIRVFMMNVQFLPLGFQSHSSKIHTQCRHDVVTRGVLSLLSQPTVLSLVKFTHVGLWEEQRRERGCLAAGERGDP